eukprot:5305530-Pleurochrysis_carterae.AAC.1
MSDCVCCYLHGDEYAGGAKSLGEAHAVEVACAVIYEDVRLELRMENAKASWAKLRMDDPKASRAKLYIAAARQA